MVSQLVEKQILIRSVTESSVKIRVKYEKFVEITKSGRNALLGRQLIKAPKQQHILENLSPSQENFHRLSALRKEFGNSPVNSLISKGFLQEHQVEIDRDPLNGKFFKTAQPVKLSKSQKAALEQISELICLLYTSPSPRDRG